MPRHKIPLKTRLNHYISEFGRDILKTDNSILFCIPCNCAIQHADERTKVLQHLNTSNHKDNLNLKSNFQQQFLPEILQAGDTKQTRFNRDLCSAFAESDIPLRKLSNPALSSFLAKWIQVPIPDESTLRKNYIPILYSERLSQIQKLFANAKVWVGMDELTDTTGRAIGAVLAGRLSPDGFEAPYLIHCAEMEKVNHHTMAALFNDSLRVLIHYFLFKY